MWKASIPVPASDNTNTSIACYKRNASVKAAAFFDDGGDNRDGNFATAVAGYLDSTITNDWNTKIDEAENKRRDLALETAI